MLLVSFCTSHSVAALLRTLAEKDRRMERGFMNMLIYVSDIFAEKILRFGNPKSSFRDCAVAGYG